MFLHDNKTLKRCYCYGFPIQTNEQKPKGWGITQTWGMGLGQGNLKNFYKGIQTWGIDIVGPISYHVPS